ncbi:MAG: hypothetical protein DSO02_02305 [Hadesarchaea archaeon]|nr:MAG: hypothetical protein DSO02_02305 [Hadesarchaea archaeon]
MEGFFIKKGIFKENFYQGAIFYLFYFIFPLFSRHSFPINLCIFPPKNVSILWKHGKGWGNLLNGGRVRRFCWSFSNWERGRT